MIFSFEFTALKYKIADKITIFSNQGSKILKQNFRIDIWELKIDGFADTKLINFRKEFENYIKNLFKEKFDFNFQSRVTEIQWALSKTIYDVLKFGSLSIEAGKCLIQEYKQDPERFKLDMAMKFYTVKFPHPTIDVSSECPVKAVIHNSNRITFNETPFSYCMFESLGGPHPMYFYQLLKLYYNEFHEK